MARDQIAVIGAGAAGLCVAKHLSHRGHDVTILEAGTQIGGLWVYENDSGRSPAYKSLRINSEAKVTGYRDFPIPKSASLYPSHWEIRDYLNAYADQFDLRSRVQFQSEVVAVEPETADGSQRWRVRTADATVRDFDRVVIANGHQSIPIHPAFAADFTGEYLHSRDYRVPEQFSGKRVLVVGTGNSGLDIAADVCTVAASTTIAARSPVLIMPRMLLGVPLARVLAKVERPWVPWPVARRVRELLTTLVHGRMEQWGLKTPKKRTHPASHPTVMAHIAWDRIRVRPGISRVDGQTVHFVDATQEEFDSVIAATGYEFDVPFLDGDRSPVSDHAIQLYRRVVHPNWPNLYFIGLFDVSGGANIRMMDIQSRWLGAVVDGEVELPDRTSMLREIESEHRRLARRYPSSPRYGLELDPRDYGLAIRADLTAAAAAKAEAEGAAAAEEAATGEPFREPVG